MQNEFLLAIPVFNEARHIQAVLSEAFRFIGDIVVIDDGSTDETPGLLARQPRAHVVRHAENLGYGASLADAFAFAAKRKYQWLITMDCDEQHEPDRIPEFIRACRTDRHDIISGSRYLDARFHRTDAPEDRRKINRRITDLLNQRLNLNLTDAFCGFKAYRVARLGSFRVTVPGYAMPLQFWVQAWRAELRITELPVGLIYNDPSRHFGGLLDDPQSRLAHYLEVFHAELAHPAITPPHLAEPTIADSTIADQNVTEQAVAKPTAANPAVGSTPLHANPVPTCARRPASPIVCADRLGG